MLSWLHGTSSIFTPLYTLSSVYRHEHTSRRCVEGGGQERRWHTGNVYTSCSRAGLVKHRSLQLSPNSDPRHRQLAPCGLGDLSPNAEFMSRFYAQVCTAESEVKYFFPGRDVRDSPPLRIAEGLNASLHVTLWPPHEAARLLIVTRAPSPVSKYRLNRCGVTWNAKCPTCGRPENARHNSVRFSCGSDFLQLCHAVFWYIPAFTVLYQWSLHKGAIRGPVIHGGWSGSVEQPMLGWSLRETDDHGLPFGLLFAQSCLLPPSGPVRHARWACIRKKVVLRFCHCCTWTSFYSTPCPWTWLEWAPLIR